MEITAAVARPGADKFSIERVTLDDPRDDEVLVRITAVGVCHTDLVARTGLTPIPLPAVLGHEGAGVVERTGANITKVRAGDHVVLTFRSCGGCPTCRRDEPAYCHDMVALNITGRRPDGSTAIRAGDEPLASNFFGQSSFATYALAYEGNLVVVDPDLPPELAAPLGCGVQTGVGAILRSLDCQAGMALLVLGGGAVGLSAVMAGALRSCSPLIVVEPLASRRALAIELGATHVIDPADAPDLAAAVRAIAPQGVEYAFDTTGVPAVQQAAMQSLAPRGALGVVGITPSGTAPPGEMATVMRHGQTIRGIIEGDSDPDTFIPEMIALHRSGRLPFDKLIGVYPFAAINAAVVDHARGLCTKVVLRF